MMRHVSEHTLDLFILRPVLLKKQTRADVKSHLRDCTGCRIQETFLRSFYEDLRMAGNEVPVRVE
jgi:hypothetical protein